MLSPVTFHMAARYAVDEQNLDDETRTFLYKTWGCARKVYNLYVNWYYSVLEKAGYQNGDQIPKPKIPEVTVFKNQKEFSYLKEVDSLALANVNMHFKNAVKRFVEKSDHVTYTKRAIRRDESGTEKLSFRGLKGMPKFHSKAAGCFSYTTNNQQKKENNNLKNDTIRLEGDILYLPKIHHGIPLLIHRPMPEDAVIGNATVSKDGDGEIYVSIEYSYTREMDMDIRSAASNDDKGILENLRFLGLDYSQTDFYADSEGRKANYPHYYRKSEEKLARMQKQLARMKKGSSNYEKQLAKIRRLHTRIANQRKDFLQKLSTRLVEEFDVIVVEDIDLRAMGSSLSLGKNLHDNGFGMFREMLAYKLERKGSFLIKVDRFYASSQTCHCCGNKNPTVKNMDIRFWTCPVCGYSFDRDYNAAINIREEGKRVFLEYVRMKLSEKESAEKRSQNRKKKKAA